jgi:hypothetical protein
MIILACSRAFRFGAGCAELDQFFILEFSVHGCFSSSFVMAMTEEG